eukprot:SAG31_NODE_3630_length_4049_cov_2.174684_1_plen_172_part_00
MRACERHKDKTSRRKRCREHHHDSLSRSARLIAIVAVATPAAANTTVEAVRVEAAIIVTKYLIFMPRKYFLKEVCRAMPHHGYSPGIGGRFFDRGFPSGGLCFYRAGEIGANEFYPVHAIRCTRLHLPEILCVCTHTPRDETRTSATIGRPTPGGTEEQDRSKRSPPSRAH